MAKNNITDATRWRTTTIKEINKDLISILKKLPKIQTNPTAAQFLKLYQYLDFYQDRIIDDLKVLGKFSKENYRDMLGFPEPLKEKTTRTQTTTSKRR